MSRVAKAWALAALGFAGLALTFVWAPAGVALCVVSTFMTTFAAFALNVPLTQLAQAAAVLAHAAALYVASHSALLAVAMLTTGFLSMPTELGMVGLRKAFVYGPLLGGVIAGVLMLLAWADAGFWVLGAVPHVGFFGLFMGPHLLGLNTRALAALGRATLRVGEPFPELKLPSRDGSGEVDLADERGSALLILFVRGDWCPICHVLMKVVSRERQTLLDKGVKLFVITPAEGELDGELSEQFGLAAHMLHDHEAAAARRFNLLEDPDKPDEPSPLPIAVLVDAEGVIRDITSPQDVTAYTSDSRISRQLQLLPAAA